MKNTEERIKTLQNQMLFVIALIIVITIICNCLLAINNKLTARVEELKEQLEYINGDYAIEDKWLQVKINILKKNIDDLRAWQDMSNGKSE